MPMVLPHDWNAVIAGRFNPFAQGMSWVQLAVVNNLLSNLSSAGGSAPLVPVSELGVTPSRVDNTFDTYARSGTHIVDMPI
eukprot:COSAG02_NODE_6093_length_3806_cov_2.162126_2_plen_81_part_00